MAPPTKEFDALLPESGFAQAKAHLSQVMDGVVQDHRPAVVDRNRGRDRAVLVDEGDLTMILEAFHFNPLVSVSDGEFVVRLPEFNLIAGGADLDAAMAELVELAEIYAEDYLERSNFFMQTDRRAQWPWVVRFALTPPAQRQALISAESRVGVQAQLAR